VGVGVGVGVGDGSINMEAAYHHSPATVNSQIRKSETSKIGPKPGIPSDPEPGIPSLDGAHLTIV
jgi:hypothetical protein